MTFGLLGLSARSGTFGSVVASSSASVGGAVAFGRAGCGVVLSQGHADPRLGPAGLAALRDGGGAIGAVSAMRDAAGGKAGWRQLAALDIRGGSASHSGEHCAPACGDALGPGCVAIGATVTSQRVMLDMVAAFASGNEEPFGDRLLEALIAGMRAGGDRYVLQSAALRIFRPGLDFPWADLRVDFSPQPVTDLRVLWSIWEPMADGYAARALDPAVAPDEVVLEGHRPTAASAVQD